MCILRWIYPLNLLLSLFSPQLVPFVYLDNFIFIVYTFLIYPVHFWSEHSEASSPLQPQQQVALLILGIRNV